jgi:hypothetical protein
MVFSEDRSRAVTEEAFGLACYERTSSDGPHDTYLHVGVVASPDEAMIWLRGSTPARLVRIFPQHQQNPSSPTLP